MNPAHIAEHERVCFHNPARRACQTCGNWVEDSDTVYNRYHGGNPGSTDYEDYYKWCEAKEKKLHELPPSERCDCNKWKDKNTGQ